jgi:hypothetical protein
MKLEEIRTRSEDDLLYRKGRTKKYPRFRKLVEKYNETGKPLNLEDATKYMGLTHHTLRTYAKEIGLKMTILTDGDGGKWIAFKKRNS